MGLWRASMRHSIILEGGRCLILVWHHISDTKEKRFLIDVTLLAFATKTTEKNTREDASAWNIYCYVSIWVHLEFLSCSGGCICNDEKSDDGTSFTTSRLGREQ